MDSSSHVHSILQEVLRLQENCICLQEISLHELSSINRSLPPVSHSNNNNILPWFSSTFIDLHTTTLPWSPYCHYPNPLQTFPTNRNTATSFFPTASTVNSELPKPTTIPSFLSQSSTSLKPSTKPLTQSLSYTVEPSSDCISLPCTPQKLPPDSQGGADLEEESLTASLYFSHSNPSPNPMAKDESPPPKPPASISISLSSPPAKPEVSTSPNLTNSDPLTPLPPFLQSRLMPPPRPPDRISLPFPRQPHNPCFQKTIVKSQAVRVKVPD